jgi:hypothetical protein
MRLWLALSSCELQRTGCEVAEPCGLGALLTYVRADDQVCLTHMGKVVPMTTSSVKHEYDFDRSSFDILNFSSHSQSWIANRYHVGKLRNVGNESSRVTQRQQHEDRVKGNEWLSIDPNIDASWFAVWIFGHISQFLRIAKGWI